MTQRTCTRCGETKDLATGFYFYADRGYIGMCKPCRNAQTMAYYRSEKGKATLARYQQSERYKERSREFQRRNNQTDKRKAYMREYMRNYYVAKKADYGDGPKKISGFGIGADD